METRIRFQHSLCSADVAVRRKAQAPLGLFSMSDTSRNVAHHVS